ncbi:cofactor-independent phosphoglycerate mutase [Polystyrenella longa]|uniref:Cofactor-independent phosphoglycerate mutase n=1 Tax=Polystyrenella longa TaxID=2528007 RepID=A0A518CRK3_9PLAN|nr:cofactor-independent phosphoglycerate mutase [Polystyrenella longa]QDU81840.1 cofactor-independent phosphoglycerate mutase [Polystyrenella longa]
MKYVLVIPDGVADEPQESLGGKTPLQASHKPNMDRVCKTGIIGQADNVPPSLPAGSDVGTMSLFGYDPLEFHTGRAPIEAAAQGIELGPDDWAVRCNLVTIQDGIMRSFTAEQISSELGAELLKSMQAAQPAGSPWQFIPGVSYRNLLLYRGEGQAAPFDQKTATYPPHDITDKEVDPWLPAGKGGDLLQELMKQSEGIFLSCDSNQARAGGVPPASGVWLWGQGKAPSLVDFKTRFGLSGAVITAVDLLRGLGRLIGWDVVEVPGATGYLDTDYTAKGQYAIETIKEKDFVVVHVEATDEASHEGNAVEKVKALEAIDREIVGPVHEFLQSQGEYRLLVSPDHPTLLRTKTHSHGYVPFTMCGTGIDADGAETYDEPTAAKSAISIPGHEVIPLLVR